jgi:hypothetical protein
VSGLDAGTLMTLFATGPEQRGALVQRLLLERLGGEGGGLADLLAEQRGTPADNCRASSRLRGLYREAAMLDTELGRTAHLLGRIAEALGACGRCLGEDEACELCGGAGAPGSEAPDPDGFAELVAPAVHRLAQDVGDIDHEERS